MGNILSEIKKKYTVNSISNSNIREFSIFNCKIKPILYKTFQISDLNSSINLCYVRFTHEWVEASYSGGRKCEETNSYHFGYIENTINLGNTIIRPESFYDKCIDFFIHVEIDFKEHKEFSKKYYLITENEQLVRDNLNKRIMDLFCNYNDIYIEFRNNKCLFFLNSKMNLKSSLLLCEFGLKLSEIIKICP